MEIPSPGSHPRNWSHKAKPQAEQKIKEPKMADTRNISKLLNVQGK